ncbi:MAG: antitoxin VapB family protein [Candidatus Helarchaeota archaeon]
MTSKTISVTEEVYNELVKIKGENESFSQLFMRLLKLSQHSLERLFGAWDLSEEEMTDVWHDLSHRPGRSWRHMGELE